MKSEPKVIMLLVAVLLSTLVIGMSIQDKTHTQKSVSKSTEVAVAIKEDKPKTIEKNKKNTVKDTKIEEKKDINEEQKTDLVMVAEEEVIVPVVEQIVYDGLTISQLASKLDRSLNSSIAGKGYLFATEALALGIDPYMAVAIVLHETGCKWDCSYLVKACNNVGGMKGSPGCNGGSYASFPTLDDGIRSYLSNLHRNYYSYGLTTPETIGPKYASSTTWSSKINWYMNSIRSN